MLKGLQIFNSKLAIPIVLLMILAMVILPLPAILLDGFFTFNIMLAIVVLLVSSTVKRVLDFSVFPSFCFASARKSQILGFNLVFIFYDHFFLFFLL